MSAKSGEQQLALFEASRDRGDVGRSFSHLSLALYLLPHLKHSYYKTYLRIFEEWIGQVQETKSFSDVMTIFEVAQKHFPDSPDLSLLLARAFYRY